MAAKTKKTSTTKEATSSEGTKKKAVSNLRKLNNALSQAVKSAEKATGAEGSSPPYERQVQEQDPFSSFYTTRQLAVPPYSFNRLYDIYEESDILQACVEAMQRNIDGFGYDVQFIGESLEERGNTEMQAQMQKLTNFFDMPNEYESFTSARKQFREDFEVLGIGGFECIRNKVGELHLMYYAPFRNIRMSSKLTDPVEVNYKILRNGKIVNVPIKKRFRKFAQISDTTQQKLRWFKQFGDPRVMDYRTGEFKKTTSYKATEIFHIKHPFGGLLYGMPRWIACVLDVLGRRAASYVNYDMFENQGIPPMLISLLGGSLTDESVDSLKNFILGMRGLAEWNKIAVLEVEPDVVGIDDKGKADIKFHDTAAIRKEDLMFEKYQKAASDNVRQRYRLPPMYSGGTSDYTYAGSRVSQSVAEEQIFIPERNEFDEDINVRIVWHEMGIAKWRFRSKGPQIVGAKEISTGIGAFMRAGALTVNSAIELVNRSFGMAVAKRDEQWAEMPVVLLTKWIEKGGQLKELSELGPMDDGSTPNPEQFEEVKSLPDSQKADIRKIINDLSVALEQIPQEAAEE